MKVRRVLIVDDEELICVSMKTLLESHFKGSVEAFYVTCRIEATNEIQQKSFDYVFVDVQMPCSVKGEGLLSAIKSRQLACEMYIWSGYSQSMEEVSKLLNDGAAGFFAKPFHPDDIYHVIRVGDRGAYAF